MSEPHHCVGVGLVGTGFGLKVHLPALLDCPNLQIASVFHRDQTQAESIAQAHYIPHATSDLADLLANPAIQGICLSTPPFLHYDMATQALEAGKHVFLEKPITMTSQQAKALYRLSRQKQLQLAVDFEFRFVPAWMTLKAKLENREIGKLRLIKIDWLVPGRADPNRVWSWQASLEAGGGALGSLGSHAFDYIAWLFGPVKQICAQLTTSIQYRPDSVSGMPKSVDADDTCLIMLELIDQTPIQLSISTVTYGGRGHWVEIYGDHGALKLGSDRLDDYVHGFKLWGTQRNSEFSEIQSLPDYAFKRTHPDGRIAPVSRAMDSWAEDILRHRSLAPTIRAGVYAQLLMDIARESHETGCWVSIPDLETFLEN